MAGTVRQDLKAKLQSVCAEVDHQIGKDTAGARSGFVDVYGPQVRPLPWAGRPGSVTCGLPNIEH